MKTMRAGIIYRATNLITEKVYIGQTICGLNTRIANHYSESKAKSNRKFYRALKKYEKQDWDWEILYKDIPLKMLDLAEICVVFVHDSRHNGYNSTDGGDINPMLGKRHSEETRKKLSVANSGDNNPMYGRHHSKETRKKIGIASRQRVHSEETKRKIGIGASKALIGKPKSEEHRRKISEARMGSVASEETKRKMSNLRKGENHPMFGKKHSEATKSKISATLSGKNNPGYGKARSKDTKDKISANNAMKRPDVVAKVVDACSKTYRIICPDGSSYIIKNLAKYCRENGLDNSGMVAVSKGRRKHYKKYKCVRVPE